MGLDLEVGALALRAEDTETQQYLRAQFDAVNRHLAAAGLPAHREPASLPSEQTVSFKMLGYSGLHYLRRVAVYLAAGQGVPEPGTTEAPQDSLMEQYYEQAAQPAAGLLRRWLRRRPAFQHRFDHLLLHSDAEGYYVPVDFGEVVFAPETEVAGSMIGSSLRLQRECGELAAALGLPRDLDPESDELWQAADAQGQAHTGWQRYGVEAFTCVRLLRAAECSVSSGAAIVFC